MTREEAIVWLRGLGDKFLGDGICQSLRASDLLAAMADTENTRAPAGGSEPTDAKALLAEWAAGQHEATPFANRCIAIIRALASAPAAAPLPLTDENAGQRIADMLMECAERLGNFPDADVDVRAWRHLLTYAPRECRGTPAAGEPLTFTIEQRGETRVLVWWPGNGCRPATDEECELWDALAASSHQAAPSGSGEVDGSDTRAGGE